MKIEFSKYEGAGNDFIIIDNRNLAFPHDELVIRKLCDRHFGIGADGLLLVQNSEAAEFEMIYFNSDGNAATFCGNGGRCIVAFAYKAGLIGKTCRFAAADGIHSASILNSDKAQMTIELMMTDATIYKVESEQVYLNTGTFHIVKFVDNPDEIDLVKEGSAIRYMPEYQPHGTNVNFVKIDNSELFIRTYEKGVEAETLACGTGITASAIAASLKEGGNHFDVHAVGGDLKVDFVRKGNAFTNIKLTGPATYVFNGTLNILDHDRD